MSVFAVLFALSAAVFTAAVWRAEQLLARTAAGLCAVSYLGFLAVLVVGGIRG